MLNHVSGTIICSGGLLLRSRFIGPNQSHPQSSSTINRGIVLGDSLTFARRFPPLRTHERTPSHFQIKTTSLLYTSHSPVFPTSSYLRTLGSRLRMDPP